MDSRTRYEALPTPVTPGSADALTSLLNMIEQIPETDRPRKEKLRKKVVNAAHISFAKNALLQDRNEFLAKINDEGKVRRSTRSEIIGKAKVMSYEDLQEARVERVTKKAAKEAKKAAKEAKRVATAALAVEEANGDKKRGRKRKNATSGGDAPELTAKVARMSEIQVAEGEQEGSATATEP